jgi:hypothetical protein
MVHPLLFEYRIAQVRGGVIVPVRRAIDRNLCRFITLLPEGFSEERRNAAIFLWLADDPSPEVSEELVNDAEAKQVAEIVANELSRNRYDGEEIAVLVFNDRGQLIHKVWTRPHDAAVATRQTLFPEHVHPKGFYQIRPAAAVSPAS